MCLQTDSSENEDRSDVQVLALTGWWRLRDTDSPVSMAQTRHCGKCRDEFSSAPNPLALLCCKGELQSLIEPVDIVARS